MSIGTIQNTVFQCLVIIAAFIAGPAVLTYMNLLPGFVPIASLLVASILFVLFAVVISGVFDLGDKALGPATMRNKGAKAANNELVLFTDADTAVSDHWVKNHCRHYDRPDVVGVGGPVLAYNDGLYHRIMHRIVSDYWYRISWPLGLVQQSGNNCSFRRSAFFDSGGYDEALGALEDTEFSLRMKKYGTIVYDTDAYVRTSTRRESEDGYVILTLMFVWRYLRFFAGYPPRSNYYRDWSDDDQK